MTEDVIAPSKLEDVRTWISLEGEISSGIVEDIGISNEVRISLKVLEG